MNLALAIIAATASAAALVFWLRHRRDQRAVTHLLERSRRIELTESAATRSDPILALRDEIDRLAALVESTTGSAEQHETILGELSRVLREGLLVINRNKRIVLVNQRLRELFPIAGDPRGKPFVEVIRLAPLLSAYDRALAGTPSAERITLTASGMTHHLELRVFPAEASSEIAAVALFIDVSRLVRLESMRRDFIADFSHEVRTPLAGLRSAVESFVSGPVDAATEDHLHRIILRQLDRLERLVEGLGELEQIESGALALAPQQVDLTALANEVADDLHDAATQAHIELAVHGETTVAWGDPGRLQQVITNLVDNALRHSGSTRVKIELADSSDHAILRVQDFGAGIPRTDHERIFHRFYRVDKSRSQETPGTGLGLAIAKHLVLLHGGTITLESAPGEGATFEVRLPKERP